MAKLNNNNNNEDCQKSKQKTNLKDNSMSLHFRKSELF